MRVTVALLLAVVLVPTLGIAGVGGAQAQPPGVSPVPIWGVVLGTIVIAGLLYLLVHGPDGEYYRYPYYGDYYRYYYSSQYRPYFGYYPPTAPVIFVAPTLVGTVIGIVTLSNQPYIVTRDSYGYLYRYPYYGPYREYYRPGPYRPYPRTYVGVPAPNIPVRMGDSRWDAPVTRSPRAPGRPRILIPPATPPAPNWRGPRDVRCRDRGPNQSCPDKGPRR